MKKFLFLLLSAAIAVSASAGVNRTTLTPNFTRVSDFDITRTAMQKKVVKDYPFVTKNMDKAQITAQLQQLYKTGKGNLVTPARPMTFKAPARVDIPAGYVAVTLEAHDIWGDGSGYQMLLDADANAYGSVWTPGSALPSGDLPDSFYNEFEYKIPENADGALSTQNIIFDGSETILIPAGVYDYCILNPSPDYNQSYIASDYGDVDGDEDNFEFVEGCTYVFMLDRYYVGDNYYDQVLLTVLEPGSALTVPENLTVDPAATTADVDWDDSDDIKWNLRWRPWKDMTGAGTLYNFPLDEAILDEQIADFSINDADGDGYCWELSDQGLDGDYCLTSISWSSSYGSLDPDNFLYTKDVEIAEDTELEFTLWGRSDRWIDNLMVYLYVYGETEDDDAIYSLSDEDIAATTTPTTYSVPLGDLAGQTACVIFRHYNSYDNMQLYLDDIFFGRRIEPNEWHYENGLTDTEFPIEGLTPETHYEVQVQAAGTASVSDWTDIVDFWTLAEAPAIPDVYMLGGNIDNWDPADGTNKFEYDEDNQIYTFNYTFDGRYDGFNFFGFTTMLGTWDEIAPYRFGAVADDDFLVTDQYLNVPLSLTYENYKAYKIPAGEYDLTVNLNTMELTIVRIKHALLGDANDDGEVNIADVTTMIDFLLGADVATWNEDNANINQDDTISVTDITDLIDFLLTGAK